MGFKIRYCKVIFIAFTLLFSAVFAWALDDGFSSAKTVEGKYTTTYYLPEMKTSDLIQKLNTRPSDDILSGIKALNKNSKENELAASADSLLVQVSDILDMHAYSTKVIVKICNNAGELQALYRNMFAQELGPRQSFYVYDTNSIYISEDSLKREILGHEMAHAVISRYFVIPAPIKIQEVLAMYVEYNLRRPAK